MHNNDSCRKRGGGDKFACAVAYFMYNLPLQYIHTVYIFYFSGPGFLCGPPRFDCLKMYLMINILKEQYHEIVRLFFDWSNTLPGPLLTA